MPIAVRRERLLAPGRDDGWALHHRPFVLVGRNHGEAVGFAAFPGRTVAIFIELPGTFAFGPAFSNRYASGLTVSRESHLERDPGRRRSREFGPIEER